MNENGLAQMSQQSQPMRNINQIAQMIKQGISPEELIQMGVPQELVMAALDIIGQEANTIPVAQEGLAGMRMQGM